MNQEFSAKIKLPVSPENKTRIIQCIEDGFNKIGTCEVDGDEVKVSKINTLLNDFNASCTVKLKEQDDGYTVNASLAYAPSVNFWIGVGISAALVLLGGVGLILFGIDAALFFFGRKKLLGDVGGAFKKVEQEF